VSLKERTLALGTEERRWITFRPDGTEVDLRQYVPIDRATERWLETQLVAIGASRVQARNASRALADVAEEGELRCSGLSWTKYRALLAQLSEPAPWSPGPVRKMRLGRRPNSAREAGYASFRTMAMVSAAGPMLAGNSTGVAVSAALYITISDSHLPVAA
jgi:hypothetical protein